MSIAQRLNEKVCEECGDWLLRESFPSSPHQKDGLLPKCWACVDAARPNIHARIARWYDHATRNGIKLDVIAVHSSDFSAAPSEYKGLKVVPIGRML